MDERGGDSLEDIDNNIITGLVKHSSNTCDDEGQLCLYWFGLFDNIFY